VNGTASRKGSDERGSEEKTGILPPLSALASPQPVDPASHFSWSGLSSSLRAGPLSPAMLAGPTNNQQHNTGHPSAPNASHGGFDPNTFRTGFTPGVGSGFTPGYAGLLTAGGGFPMPSPNTAAFLSMVTNGTPGSGAQGAGQDGREGKQDSGHPGTAIPSHLTGPTPSATVDITPNTLNALTGVINQMNSSEPSTGGMFPPPPPPLPPAPGGPVVHPNGATGHQLPPPPHPEHPMSTATDYFGPSAPHGHHPLPPAHSNYPNQPMSLPPAHLHSSADPRTHVNGQYGMHPQQAMMNPNPQAAAANGLFLLSQAHQELSKREEEQRSEGPLGATGRPRNKRKSDDAGKPSVGATGRPSGKRSKKNAPDPPPRNGFVPAYPGQSILQQSQALLAQGAQAQAERDAMIEEGDDDEDQKMLDLAGHGKDGEGADGKKDGKPETEEEKRKNFLERNRQGESLMLSGSSSVLIRHWQPL
jgi:ATF/CREB family transcription factor